MSRAVPFTFGKNWKSLLDGMDDSTLALARSSLLDFLRLSSLDGLSFLDIGCGSGLFSLGAFDLGAKRIESIDADPESVASARRLHGLRGLPANWTIRRTSINDPDFGSGIETADVVYSWGVLHHTGDLWSALAKVVCFVNPGGRLYIAIYNAVPGVFGSKSWLRVKVLYNRSSTQGRRLLEWIYAACYGALCLVRLRSPFAAVRDFPKTHRGLDWVTCMRDRLGGLPYEYASAQDVADFMSTRFPHFVVENEMTHRWVGNNWFLFRNTDSGSPVK